MKLKKNKSYLLNFARRQGKTTTLLDLVVKNAVSKPGSSSICILLNYGMAGEFKTQLTKKLTDKGISIQKIHTNQAIYLTNGSKIILTWQENAFDILRGRVIDFVYIDDLHPFSVINNYDIQFADICWGAYNLIITTSCTTTDLHLFKNMFKNKPYEIIIKPYVPVNEQVEKDLKAAGGNANIGEITLGLSYGFF